MLKVHIVALKDQADNVIFMMNGMVINRPGTFSECLRDAHIFRKGMMESLKSDPRLAR